MELAVVGLCEPDCGSMAFRQTKSVPHLTINPPGSIPCDGEFHERAMTVEVADDAPAGTLFFELEATHGPATCYGLGTVDVTEIAITAERIDQDAPTNAAWISLLEGGPVYGGSEPSTADNLRLRVDPGPNVVNISWSVEGAASADWLPPSSGPTATEWNLGDLTSPQAGKVTFKVEATHADPFPHSRVPRRG